MHRTLLAAALAAALWSFLGSLWGEEGCHIDPDGRCVGAADQVDTGCNIDPSGRCTG